MIYDSPGGGMDQRFRLVRNYFAACCNIMRIGQRATAAPWIPQSSSSPAAAAASAAVRHQVGNRMSTTSSVSSSSSSGTGSAGSLAGIHFPLLTATVRTSYQFHELKSSETFGDGSQSASQAYII